MRYSVFASLVMVLLAACTPQPAPYLAPVESALVDSIGHAYFGGKVFCAYDLLETKTRADLSDVYVWAFCGEYVLDGHTLNLGTASSLPVAIHLQKSGATYRVVSFQIPQDGTGFLPSIQAAFPADAIRRMCLTDTACYNERAGRLEKLAQQKAREYFGLD